MNWKNILERASWTALQAAIASVPVAQVATALTSVNLTALEQLALSALGAAIGAFLSFVKTVAQERLALLLKRGEHA